MIHMNEEGTGFKSTAPGIKQRLKRRVIKPWMVGEKDYEIFSY